MGNAKHGYQRSAVSDQREAKSLLHKRKHVTRSAQETFTLGEKLAGSIRPGDIFLLFGNLGSGKTCFTQGFAKGLGIEEQINSPTYIYIHSYKRTYLDFHHVDLYRVEAAEKLTTIGMEDLLLDNKNILVIEWPEIIYETLLNGNRRLVEIRFQRVDENTRSIDIMMKD